MAEFRIFNFKVGGT